MTKAEPTASTQVLQQNNITLLFEDPHLLVLSKPSGLLSQADKTGEPSLVDLLRVYLGRNYVGLVHRLDRNTSGIMIVAKRTKSAQRLTDALQAGKVQRSYLAWLVGELSEPVRWTHYLEKDQRTNTVRVVKKGNEGKIALLSATPIRRALWRSQICTLAQITLETGRSHQIRVQAAYEGFPILGDRKYGKGLDFSRVALHSHTLEFPHPMTEEILTYSVPLPKDLQLDQPQT